MLPALPVYRSVCQVFVFLLFATTSLTQTVLAQGTASVQGVIEAQDGTPIAGASVTYGAMAAPRGKAATAMMPPVGQVTSNSKGTFSIQSLKAGVYLVCVSTKNQPYLDPCHWSTTPATFTLVDGQAISNAVIKVAKGQQYQIRVNDPQQNFASEGKSPGANLVMGIRALSGAFHSAVLASSDSSGRNYTVTVPFDTPINLSVLPGTFQLSDGGGLAVASAGGQYPINAPSSGSIPTLTFTLNGVGKP
jgi:hypothetical protein